MRRGNVIDAWIAGGLLWVLAVAALGALDRATPDEALTAALEQAKLAQTVQIASIGADPAAAGPSGIDHAGSFHIDGAKAGSDMDRAYQGAAGGFRIVPAMAWAH